LKGNPPSASLKFGRSTQHRFATDEVLE